MRHNLNLEDLLGTNISDIPNSIEMSNLENLDERTYITQSLNYITFGGKSFNQILLLVGPDNRIIEINVPFNEIFDTRTLSELVQVYGNPTIMYKMGELEEVLSEESDSDFNIKVKEYRGKMIECGLDEDPTQIIWEGSDFTMNLMMVERSGKTMLTIKKR